MDVFDLVATISLDKSEYDKGLDEASKSSNNVGAKIGKGLKTVGVVAAAGLTAASAGVAALAKSAVDGYADYEQLLGGVQKLYGTGGKSVEEYAQSVGKSVSDVQDKYNGLVKAQNTVLTNAQEAYKTSGMSMNQYMETATQFSASLISSLGGDTQKAAEQTDVAMRAISDNYNTFGGNIEDVTNAVKGFSKQNYTMLDNLKLGYGGTKEEMERLIKDANEWGKANNEASNLSIDSFADVITAIQQIQEKQGIAGTTAREASTTISGSIGMVKAAWQNVVTEVAAGNGDLDQSISDLIDSIIGYTDEAGNHVNGVIDNLIPVISQALEGIGEMVQQLAPIIADQLPKLTAEILPPLISAAGILIAGLISALPGMLDLIAQALPGMMQTIWDAIANTLTDITPLFRPLVDGVNDLIQNFDELLPVIAGVTAAFVAFKTVMAISAIISSVTAALAAFEKAQNAATVAQAALNAVMSANPFAIVITVVAGLVAAIVTLYNTNETAREIIDNAWLTIQTTINDVTVGIQTAVTTAWTTITTSISTAISTIQSVAQSGFSAVQNAATSIFENIRSTIITKINAAKQGVHDAIEKMKSFFHFTWELPRIKLPHFHISGKFSLNPPQAPHFSVDWYRKAMEQPYMFSKATLFGAGEAGDEVMYGKNNLMSDIKEAMSDVAGRGGNTTINVYGAEGQDVRELAEQVADLINNRVQRRQAAYA